MKIDDYMDELKEYDFAAEFGEYDSGIISEIISEIADSDISVYTQPQIEYAMEHADSADNALANGLVGEPSSYTSFRDYAASVGVAAWYEDNCSTMYDNIEECVLYAICEALKSKYDINELSDEQIEELEVLDFNIGDYLESVIGKAAEAIRLAE